MSRPRPPDVVGQFFDDQHDRAFRLFRQLEFDKANDLCLWLLSQPELSEYDKAGCHLILAHSPDEYVHHAHEAGHHATPEQQKSKEELVRGATQVLELALRDAKEYGEDKELDMEELQNDSDEEMEDECEGEDEVVSAGESDEPDEDSAVAARGRDAPQLGIDVVGRVEQEGEEEEAETTEPFPSFLPSSSVSRRRHWEQQLNEAKKAQQAQKAKAV